MALDKSLKTFKHDNLISDTQCINCQYHMNGFCICTNTYLTWYEQMTGECEYFMYDDQQEKEKTQFGKSRK